MKYFILLLLTVASLVVGIDNNFKIRKNMADNKQAFDDLRTKLNDATNRLAEKIRRLSEKALGGGMSSEEEDQVRSDFDAIASQLDALGADEENPVPEVTE